MNGATAVLDRIGDRFNPILIKEMRQAVRSRYTVAILILFLVVSMGITGFPVITSSSDESLGRGVFAGLSAVLLFACVFFVPSYAATRLSMERYSANMDLLFTAAISPRQIVSGKFCASMIVTLLIFATCLPFMVYSYILRGIDLAAIALVLVLYLLASAMALQGAIFVACLPVSRVFRLFLSLATLVGYLIMFSTCVGASANFVFNDGGSFFGSGEFWPFVLWVAFVFFAIFGFLSVTAVSLISPPQSNRTFLVRIHLSLVWLIATIGAAITALVTHDAEPFEVWANVSLCLWAAALLLCVSERDTYSPRICRNIPRNVALRPLAFLFYSGAGGGLTWCTFLAALTFGGGMIAVIAGGDLQTLLASGCLWLYGLGYALSALFIRRVILRNHLKPGTTWTIAIMLMSLGMAIPGLAYALFSDALHIGAFEYSIFAIGNPFMTYSADSHLYKHALFLLPWIALVILLNGFWYGRQIRDYQPESRQKEQT